MGPKGEQYGARLATMDFEKPGDEMISIRHNVNFLPTTYEAVAGN